MRRITSKVRLLQNLRTKIYEEWNKPSVHGLKIDNLLRGHMNAPVKFTMWNTI